MGLPAQAQVGTIQPLQDFQDPGKGDPFSNRGTGPMNGVMDLIHRSVLGPSRSLDEFASEQQESLDAATADFRAKQMERLRQQQAAPSSPTSTTPATTAPSVPNPAVQP
jgi:hypothetical protein